MAITRLSVLPDDRGLLLGIDKAGVFEAGVVYELEKVLGEIVIRRVGKYALPKLGGPACESSDIATIVFSGLQLVTKEELGQMVEAQNNKEDGKDGHRTG